MPAAARRERSGRPGTALPLPSVRLHGEKRGRGRVRGPSRPTDAKGPTSLLAGLHPPYPRKTGRGESEEWWRGLSVEIPTPPTPISPPARRPKHQKLLEACGHSPARSSMHTRASPHTDFMAVSAAVAEENGPRHPRSAGCSHHAAPPLSPVEPPRPSPSALSTPGAGGWGSRAVSGQLERTTPNMHPMGSLQRRGLQLSPPIVTFHVRFPADGAWPAPIGRPEGRLSNRFRGAV